MSRVPQFGDFSISIHASRGGSDLAALAIFAAVSISIHASRGGSDSRDIIRFKRYKDFNPRFPRGKRHFSKGRKVDRVLFQSTLPAGEATDPPPVSDSVIDISIHASRGGSDNYVSL